MNDHSELLSVSLGILYPIILIFGIYVIVSGHLSPGGGFQGGAILSAVMIVKYLIQPINDTPLNKIQTIEKLTLLLILLIPLLFIYMGLNQVFPALNPYYLIVVNSLIGLKVACGMTIIFIRFVFYEIR